MKNQTNEVRALMRSVDPDGRPLEDPTVDPGRAGYYAVISAGDPQKITQLVDKLLDELEAVREALRVRVATGSAARR